MQFTQIFFLIFLNSSWCEDMYLLTEWEGRTEKYLVRGHDVRTECTGLCALWPSADHFPDQTQTIGILSYDHRILKIPKILFQTR